MEFRRLERRGGGAAATSAPLVLFDKLMIERLPAPVSGGDGGNIERGVRCRAPIVPHEEIVSIPRRFLLTVEDAEDCALGRAIVASGLACVRARAVSLPSPIWQSRAAPLARARASRALSQASHSRFAPAQSRVSHAARARARAFCCSRPKGFWAVLPACRDAG